MNIAPKSSFVLNHRHLLGIEGLSRDEIVGLLDLSEEFVALNRQIEKKTASLRGRTQINLFFESSTRTQPSFELAMIVDSKRAIPAAEIRQRDRAQLNIAGADQRTGEDGVFLSETVEFQ